MDVAAISGYVDIVGALLARYPNLVNAQDKVRAFVGLACQPCVVYLCQLIYFWQNGASVLHLASGSGQNQVVQLLLNYPNVSTNLRDNVFFLGQHCCMHAPTCSRFLHYRLETPFYIGQQMGTIQTR